nr:hypothetical protein [Streptomyces sp. 846.5]
MHVRDLGRLLLTALKDQGLAKAGVKQRTDSTRVLAAVRDLNRLELAGETLRAALEALACAAPDWLADAVPLREWAERYGPRADSEYLSPGRPRLASPYETDARYGLKQGNATSASSWSPRCC